MTKIDLFSLTTVPLDLCANGNTVGNATGFVWKDREQHYLITNWHVVTGRNAQTGKQTGVARPDMVSAIFNTRLMNFGKKTYDISIRDAEHKPLAPSARAWIGPGRYPIADQGRRCDRQPESDQCPEIGRRPCRSGRYGRLYSRLSVRCRAARGFPFGNGEASLPNLISHVLVSATCLWIQVRALACRALPSFGAVGAFICSKTMRHRKQAGRKANSLAFIPAAVTRKTNPTPNSAWSGRWRIFGKS